MRISIGQLRKLIKGALVNEWAGTAPTKPNFEYIGNPLSPSTNDREALGYLADQPTDVDPNDGISDHLKTPVEDPEDCYGPVPPTQGDPWVSIDPFTRDASPLPSPRR